MLRRHLTTVFMGMLMALAFVLVTSHAAWATTTSQPQETTVPATTQSIANGVCQGVLGTEDTSTDSSVTIKDCTTNDGGETFMGVIKRIINMFSILVGSVSVIMIIIGGFRYIISGGDSAGVGAATITILYAIVGLVIVLFSQIIVRFIVSNLTNVTNTTTQQPTSSQTTTK